MCVLNCRDRFIASLLAIESVPGRDTSQSCSNCTPDAHKGCITDAHKGLPYYTLTRATHVLYSRVAPCGRPLIPIIAESSLPQEDVVVQRWWSLSSGTPLPLIDGGICQLVYAGRSGGPAGPDVRDAVLLFPDGKQHVGDIEFHVRSSDWVTHKHFIDPRYNNVILHVVLLCDDLHPTTRQDGYSIPVCSLYDIPIAIRPENDVMDSKVWPCHTVMRNLSVAEQEKLLHQAGLLRFEQKTHAFVEVLHRIETAGPSQDQRTPTRGVPTIHDVCSTQESIVGTPLVGVRGESIVRGEGENRLVLYGHSLSYLYDNCLIPALAEALAYGRDRVFFRAAGQRLLGQDTRVPEPLGRAAAPSPLDTKRLNVLRILLAREPHIWESLQHILVQTQDITLQALREYFCTTGLSLARADILICNVVLPFASAIALLEHNILLGERAQTLYETHPGLSSNTITRMMCRQLLLAQEPHGSCQQQGLHYIYQQTCQAKRCAVCMMGRNVL